MRTVRGQPQTVENRQKLMNAYRDRLASHGIDVTYDSAIFAHRPVKSEI
jgi:hypothetical protein